MAEQKYTYDEIFQRNIGIFTPEEQNKIKNLKVAIAGAGGLGGPVAYILAKLGVGEIRLADPDIFLVHNINLQYGAYADTIGEKKVQVIKNDLERINPFLNVSTWDFKVTKKNVNEFLKDVDFVVDAIDFYEPKDELALHEEARKKKLWVFTAQNASTIFSVTAFNPEGTSFEEMLTINGKFSMEAAINKFFPILPKRATPDLIKKVIEGKKIEISSIATSPFVGASFLVEELIRVVKKGDPLVSAPDIYLFDFEIMKGNFFVNGKLK